MTRFIDLSIPITERIVTDPAPLRPKIHYSGHREGAAEMQRFFPGLRESDLPDGEAWAVERLELSTHSGTHMDAPWHYHSTTWDGTQPSPTIDQAPLDLFLRPGVKLDFRHLADGHVVTAQEVEAEFERIGYTLRPFDIVLVNTRAGEAYGGPDYVDAGCGMGREATNWLTARGVQVVGIDAWSWDAPFVYTAQRFAQTRDAAIIWEGHKAGRERPYYQMEKLHRLETLPSHGFTVSCFPVKIEAASAGWCRCVALLEDA